MIDKKSMDRNRFINGVLIVVAIGLLAASIYSVYSAWRTGLAQSRAETASRLMAIRTSPRSTETPGINAWVSWSLLHGDDETASPDDRLRQWVAPRADEQFPQAFQPLLNALRRPLPKQPLAIEFKSDEDLGGTATNADLEFRNVDYVACNDQVLILTARNNEMVQSGIEEFAALAATHLTEIQTEWQASPELPSLQSTNRLSSARVARLYILNEDESLISLPLAEENGESDNRMLLSEGDEFRKNPRSPSFVSNNFFFNFRYQQPLDRQAIFSGMYLDLGGLGLVASVIRPAIYNGKRCVLGADIAFDIDWEAFAQNLSPNLTSQVVHINESESAAWNPWSEFHQNLPRPSALRYGICELAEQESVQSQPTARKSVYLANTRNGGHAMAIQVSRATWLLLLVPPNEIKLPWTTMLLTSLVFLSLLFRIEWSRRKAFTAQRSARNELQEKQNLLETMQVPLMVVDPSTDEIVYCNRAAEIIGMSPGLFFGRDIVAPDLDSQEQYRRTQTLNEKDRRAYGIPIRTLPTATGQDTSQPPEYAVVRSVAVTAPIESLRADQRHRLGILFLIDENVDLPILLRQRIAETQQDEKRRLSGLMNHGIDSLARVLRNQLKKEIDEGSIPARREFAFWLSRYVSERIQLLSWILENWGTRPSNVDRRMMERETVIRTVEQHNRIFETVASDRPLREQLHWNNGPIASRDRNPSESAMIQTKIDWDPDCCFAVPREGVFGFLLSELLINAVRHGESSSGIELEICHNRNRNEIVFQITNDASPIAENKDGKPFGGVAIINELARLCGWESPNRHYQEGRYQVSWTIPAMRRKDESQGD